MSVSRPSSILLDTGDKALLHIETHSGTTQVRSRFPNCSSTTASISHDYPITAHIITSTEKLWNCLPAASKPARCSPALLPSSSDFILRIVVKIRSKSAVVKHELPLFGLMITNLGHDAVDPVVSCAWYDSSVVTASDPPLAPSSTADGRVFDLPSLILSACDPDACYFSWQRTAHIFTTMFHFFATASCRTGVDCFTR